MEITAERLKLIHRFIEDNRNHLRRNHLRYNFPIMTSSGEYEKLEVIL